MTRQTRGWVILVTMLVAGAAFVALRAPGAVRIGGVGDLSPPNVLIVLWDTVRADRMSMYGYERPTTPELDAFAADARVYEQAISPGMWTVPSHGSLFTGLPVGSHGARVGWLWLDGHHVTLAEHFGANGYATWAWSSNPYLSVATNLLQGFDTIELSWDGDQAIAAAKATTSKLIQRDASVAIAPGWQGDATGWPRHLTAYKDGAPVAVDSLLAWVDALPEASPWFAYVNLLEAHHPRLPSLEARRAVASDELVERGLSTDASLFRIMSAMEGRGEFTEAELEAVSAVYDATLVDLDRSTGRLFDELQRRGALDDTVVIVVSDHGEHLGEHGMFDHRWSLHQPLVHVPLLVRGPGVEAGRVSEPVSTHHLFGSLLAWTNLPSPAVAHPLPLLGSEPRAFTELVASTPRLPEIRSAFPELRGSPRNQRLQAVVEDGWKLWRVDDGSRRLFHLPTDPGEHDDRIHSEPSTAIGLWDTLIDWNQVRPRYDASRRGADDRPLPPLELDASLREQLELLGYAVGEEDP